MAYRVSLAAPAETDAYAAFERIREVAPLHAEGWLTRLFEAIFSLDDLPRPVPRHPRSKRAWLSRPPPALWQRKRGLPNHLSHREDEQHVRGQL